MNFVFATFIFIGYMRLAVPACRGEPHTLPLDSTVLANYPCRASYAEKLLYLMRNARPAVWDVFQLGVQDRYLSYCTHLLFFRLVSAFLLPARIYCEVRRCLFRLAHRRFRIRQVCVLRCSRQTSPDKLPPPPQLFNAGRRPVRCLRPEVVRRLVPPLPGAWF